MQPATAETVLADFDDTSFTYNGVTTTFRTSDGKYFARTDGSDGRLAEFEIAYTFGVEPLQQYLVAFPDGRLQALSICWDTRPAAEGGQRWFHLYPDEAVDHEDELHWTGPQQNWNFMCAECHSTNLVKGYDAEGDRYATTWSEIDVSCEACHGPGSRHVRWAESGGADPDPDLGLAVRLKDTDGGVWVLDPQTGMSRRSVPRTDRTEIELCARCHSRRSILHDEYRHGEALMQTHRPALLTEGLYHADGQIRDEVYVYGSFLQSRMYRQGVTCRDCHDPHGLGLHGSPDTVCARCHLPAKFDAPEHHFHRPGSPGARCVACHMPERRYMVVDPRGDHGFRIPRPDLAAELGTPDPCTGCHADRPAAWAADVLAARLPPVAEPHFARAFSAAAERSPGAAGLLAAVASDPLQPAIVRASALARLGAAGEPVAEAVAREALADEDPLVRLGALEAVETLEPGARPGLVQPLLRDPVRAVRIEAAKVLAPARPSIPAPDRPALDAALDEYRRAQLVSADRAEAHLNLGLLELGLGRPVAAEREYRLAIERNARFLPAYVNLADLYRIQGREREGERALREALALDPLSAEVHHALGLLLVRTGNAETALEHLRQAATLRPAEPRYAYVYGVALHSTGDTPGALAALDRALARSPFDRDILVALATISRDAGSSEAAVRYADRLVELFPGDAGARQLQQELRSR
jgi:tetratricopeptide (TPR) repeat protein